jgi:hypothetical protein
MKAVVGDHIVVRSQHTGQTHRLGEIVEVHGPDGDPPYVVQWDNIDHPVLVVPGPDALIQHDSPR